MIKQFPKISAIYYGLLKSGYDFCSFERSKEHINELLDNCNGELSSDFFSKTKQDTCEVYPFWPRAFVLETASFYLNDSNTSFINFDEFKGKIISASNIANNERDHSLWEWLQDFPKTIDSILSDNSFLEYLEWEEKWISKQNNICQNELRLIQECLELCINMYSSPIKKIEICINPIKCVYSSDYHLIGNKFIFSSGVFKVDSIIHEFLHHIAHPYIEQQKELILKYQPINNEIDRSYYLTGNDLGLMNAFEETIVRLLTQDIINGKYHKNISSYIKELLIQK